MLSIQVEVATDEEEQPLGSADFDGELSCAPFEQKVAQQQQHCLWLFGAHGSRIVTKSFIQLAGTRGERLVEARTEAIAENLLHFWQAGFPNPGEAAEPRE